MTLSSSLPTPIFVRVTATSQPPVAPSHRSLFAPSEIVISSDVDQELSPSFAHVQSAVSSAASASTQFGFPRCQLR